LVTLLLFFCAVGADYADEGVHSLDGETVRIRSLSPRVSPSITQLEAAVAKHRAEWATQDATLSSGNGHTARPQHQQDPKKYSPEESKQYLGKAFNAAIKAAKLMPKNLQEMKRTAKHGYRASQPQPMRRTTKANDLKSAADEMAEVSKAPTFATLLPVQPMPTKVVKAKQSTVKAKQFRVRKAKKKAKARKNIQIKKPKKRKRRRLHKINSKKTNKAHKKKVHKTSNAHKKKARKAKKAHKTSKVHRQRKRKRNLCCQKLL